MEFDSFYYSPYRVQSNDDDNALVTKRHLRDLNEKLDKLFSSSSSTPSETYSGAAIKALLETFVKEHDTSIFNAAKAIDASTSSCQKETIAIEESTKYFKHATENVEKLIYDAHIFLDSLQAAALKNPQTVNASGDNLTQSLQAENKHFDEARQNTKSDYKELQTSIHDRLEKL